MIKVLKLHLTKVIKDYTKRKYLLAVSGGVDSMSLIWLFNELNLDFGVAHCNFQLRGADSTADEMLVGQTAQRYQKNFYVTHFETLKYASERKVSIQMAARELRYEWFKKLAIEHSFDFVVTAHHKNDLAETILLNLCKGTGHAGTVGIKTVNHNLLRPLLIFDKEEIRGLAVQQQLEWREDSSNSQDKYQRNHLRLNVIPLLKQINPKVEDAFLRTSEKMGATNNFILDQIEKLKAQYCQLFTDRFEVSYRLIETEKNNVFILSEILGSYGFDYYKCEKIVAHDRSEPGASFYSETHHMVCDRDKFVVVPLAKRSTPVLIMDHIPERFDFGDYNFTSKTIVLDDDMSIHKSELILPEAFSQTQIVIKYPEQGDSMAPFGMKGKTKKVADILNEAKIPLNLKNYIPIFQVGDDIIWVTGIRSSQICKVQKGEKAIIIKAFKN